MSKYAFGVDVGGTTVKLGLFDTQGGLLDKWEIPTVTENHGGAILPDVARSILAKMEEKGIPEAEVAGIGIGVPGPVDRNGCLVGRAVNLGWESFDIPKTLGAYIKVPVKAANDANVAAFGELWQGGGKGYENLVAVTLGTGGNKGCLEQYASATGIVRLAKRRLGEDQKESVLREGEISAKSVFDAVKAGDSVAVEIAERFGDFLGKGLAVVAAVVNPEVFVIGGGVSKAGEILLTFVEPNFRKHAFPQCREAKFVLARLGNDAGSYGAAALVLR